MERVLANLDAIRAEAVGLSQLKSGNLRLAAVPSLLATILPPILKEYAVRFPGIELSIFEGTDDEVRDGVTSGLAHVGLAALPLDGAMVAEGLGVSLAPSLSLRKVNRGRRTLHLKPRLFRKIGMFQSRGGVATSALEALVYLLKGCKTSCARAQRAPVAGTGNSPFWSAVVGQRPIQR